jgi:hypothetical protein
MLDRHGFVSSMSGKGNCYGKAMAGTLFKTIKSELVWRTSFQSRRQAGNAIARYIDGFDNPVRQHSALGYKSSSTKQTNRQWLSTNRGQASCTMILMHYDLGYFDLEQKTLQPLDNPFGSGSSSVAERCCAKGRSRPVGRVQFRDPKRDCFPQSLRNRCSSQDGQSIKSAF